MLLLSFSIGWATRTLVCQLIPVFRRRLATLEFTVSVSWSVSKTECECLFAIPLLPIRPLLWGIVCVYKHFELTTPAQMPLWVFPPLLYPTLHASRVAIYSALFSASILWYCPIFNSCYLVKVPAGRWCINNNSWSYHISMTLKR